MEPMSLPKDRMQEKDAVAEGLTPGRAGNLDDAGVKAGNRSEPCFHDYVSDGACSI